jgi:hypothetical protein
MISEGLVMEVSAYILGGRQHQKVYFLTDKGLKQADWMREKVSNKQVVMGAKRAPD